MTAMFKPAAPARTVKITKPIPLGTKVVWVVLTRRFTEVEAVAHLKANPTHRREVK